MLEAIILAGGFGTRLSKVVPDVPKPMAPVAGRPFLVILLNYLAHKGFDRVILSLGYKAEMISAYFGNDFAGMKIEYVVEESPLGTGGAVRFALEMCSEDQFFVFNGDTFLDLDSCDLGKLLLSLTNPLIIGCHVNDTARYGRLIMNNNCLIGFKEKGVVGPGLINAGCYALRKSHLDEFLLGEPFSLENDFFLNKAVSIDVYVTKGKFIDIGVPEDFHRAQKLLA